MSSHILLTVISVLRGGYSDVLVSFFAFVLLIHCPEILRRLSFQPAAMLTSTFFVFYAPSCFPLSSWSITYYLSLASQKGFKLHGPHRPISMKSDGIRKLSRQPACRALAIPPTRPPHPRAQSAPLHFSHLGSLVMMERMTTTRSRPCSPPIPRSR